ncbi:MAG: transcription antitermination factor NusB [Planctomycetaceae bacterium]
MKSRPEPFDSRRKRNRPFKKKTTPRPDRSQARSAPSQPVAKTSRQLAFQLLQEGDLLNERKQNKQPKLFATERLEAAFSQSSFSAEERRLTQELLNGTLRRKGTLDLLLSACCQRPLHELELPLVWLMRLGAYQLVYLDSIPDHAAVNETVDVARWYGKQRWCSYLNGNLRSVIRLFAEASTPVPATQLLPTRSGMTRPLNSPLLADPQTAPLQYLSETASFPLWLLERLEQRLFSPGSPDFMRMV